MIFLPSGETVASSLILPVIGRLSPAKVAAVVRFPSDGLIKTYSFAPALET